MGRPAKHSDSMRIILTIREDEWEELYQALSNKGGHTRALLLKRWATAYLLGQTAEKKPTTKKLSEKPLKKTIEQPKENVISQEEKDWMTGLVGSLSK